MRIDLVKRMIVKARHAVNGVSFRVLIQLQDNPLGILSYFNPHVSVGDTGIRIVAGGY